MSLPKISSPIFRATMPSTGKELKYRPFTVKEEKLLLLAAQSDETAATVDAIKQILDNCVVDDVEINKMATFDVEYLFIQLRSKSIDNIMNLRFVEDEQTYEVEVDLNDVEVVKSENHSNKIHLNEEVAITMKYPSFEMIEKVGSNTQDDIVDVIAGSIDKIVNGDEILDINDYTKDEVTAFIESFTSKNMREIEGFFNDMPKVKLDIKYKTKDGKDKVREVVGLQSFFMS